MALSTTHLGQTAVEITRIGLGSMPLAINGRPTREEAIEDDIDSIWYASNSIRQQFKLEGNYKIEFYLRLKGSSQYSLVAEKVIQAKK